MNKTKEDPVQDIGTRIRDHIEVSGLTQTEVAKRAIMAPGTLNNIISGKRLPNVASVAKLASALGVSTDKLIYGRDLQPSTLSQVVINLPDMETQQEILRRIDNWKNATWVAILNAVTKLKKDSVKRVTVTDVISFLRRWHLPGDPQERSPYFTCVQPPKLTPQRGAPSVGDLTEEALLPHIMELSPHQLAFLRQFLDDEMQQMGRKTPRTEN
jgi:transcriptional regulator with XRE-family HTH domain